VTGEGQGRLLSDRPGGCWGYTSPVHVLFVCTANICRSPMASAFFAAQTQDRADPVVVSSAGLLADSGSIPTVVPDEALEVMDTYGIDLRQHRGRALTASMLEGADLVIGMSRRHVQEAVLLDPRSWPHAFMLKELVRRGEHIGPRHSAQGLDAWIGAAHGDRTRESLAHRSKVDEVVDPYGGTMADYRATAAELSRLTARLTGLLWPDGPDWPVAPA
jgi:protein-tyrosine phosphatase